MTTVVAALSLARKFIREESGVTSIEYALIAAIVSISIVAGLTGVRGELQSSFSDVATNLQNINN